MIALMWLHKIGAISMLIRQLVHSTEQVTQRLYIVEFLVDLDAIVQGRLLGHRILIHFILQL